MPKQKERPPLVSSSGSSARERVLDSAEHEFATRGYEGASVRRITDRAGVSHGNVRHLFGSKHELLGEVYHRLFGPLNEERSAALDALLARTPDPSIVEIFDAFAEALTRFLTHENAGRHGLLALRGLTEHDAFWPFVKSGEPLASRFVDAAARALGDLPKDVVAFRWGAALQFFSIQMQPMVQNVEVPRVRTHGEITRLRRYAIAILTDPLEGECELSTLPWQIT